MSFISTLHKSMHCGHQRYRLCRINNDRGHFEKKIWPMRANRSGGFQIGALDAAVGCVQALASPQSSHHCCCCQRCFHLLLLHCTQISVQRALEKPSSKPVADSSVQVCQQALSERPLRQLSRGFPDGVIQTSCLNRAV